MRTKDQIEELVPVPRGEEGTKDFLKGHPQILTQIWRKDIRLIHLKPLVREVSNEWKAAPSLMAGMGRKQTFR